MDWCVLKGRGNLRELKKIRKIVYEAFEGSKFKLLFQKF